MGFTGVGLFLASATSVTNVFADVARKKALQKNEVIVTSFWIRLCAAFIFMTAFIVRSVIVARPVFRDAGPLFGITALHFSPLATFLIYLVLDITLVGFGTVLYFKALKITPMSFCIPYLAFTPIFLIVTGNLMLGELPPWTKIVGVVLVVIGSLVMNRELFAIGWFAPVKAIFTNRGSLYMLIDGFILALTNPIDKKLVVMSDAFTQAFAYGVLLCGFFAMLALVQKSNWTSPLRTVPGWLVVGGIFDSSALLLQFSSLPFMPVVITITIKRAGIILAVLLGWLIFKETDITDRLIAACVMAAGALILYLPVNGLHAIAIFAATCVGMAVALCLTHKRARAAQPETSRSTVAG